MAGRFSAVRSCEIQSGFLGMDGFSRVREDCMWSLPGHRTTWKVPFKIVLLRLFYFQPPNPCDKIDGFEFEIRAFLIKFWSNIGFFHLSNTSTKFFWAPARVKKGAIGRTLPGSVDEQYFVSVRPEIVRRRIIPNFKKVIEELEKLIKISRIIIRAMKRAPVLHTTCLREFCFTYFIYIGVVDELHSVSVDQHKLVMYKRVKQTLLARLGPMVWEVAHYTSNQK